MMSIEGLDLDIYTYVIETRYTVTIPEGGSLTYICTSAPEHGFARDVMVDGREIGYEIAVFYKDELMADSVSFEYVKGITTYHTCDFT